MFGMDQLFAGNAVKASDLRHTNGRDVSKPVPLLDDLIGDAAFLSHSGEATGENDRVQHTLIGLRGFDGVEQRAVQALGYHMLGKSF
jgi:hypothetical protein